MKKIFLLLLAAFLLAAVGCGKKAADEAEETEHVNSEPEIEETVKPEPAPEPEPEDEPEPEPEPEPDPEWQPATARIGDVGILYGTMERGMDVTVTGEEEECYVIAVNDEVSGEPLDLLVPKWLVRLETEEPYEEWDGYGAGSAELHAAVSPLSEIVGSFGLNKGIRVLDEMGRFMLIECDGVQGYVAASDVSDHYIQYSHSDGGGGSSGGQDGGDIVLWYQVPDGIVPMGFLRDDEPVVTEPTKGTILADGTEVYYAFTAIGEELRVTEVGEDVCTVWMGAKQFGTVPRWLAVLESDEPYEEWDGFAASKAMLYSDYLHFAEGKELNLNTELHVLYDMGDEYIVLMDDTVGYIAADSVNDAPVYYSYSGGGSSGGEWTDPVL